MRGEHLDSLYPALARRMIDRAAAEKILSDDRAQHQGRRI